MFELKLSSFENSTFQTRKIPELTSLFMKDLPGSIPMAISNIPILGVTHASPPRLYHCCQNFKGGWHSEFDRFDHLFFWGHSINRVRRGRT
jgi:hypothetical protein